MAFAHEHALAGQSLRARLARIEMVEGVEFRRRREIDYVLHLADERDLVRAVTGRFAPLQVALASSPLK